MNHNGEWYFQIPVKDREKVTATVPNESYHSGTQNIIHHVAISYTPPSQEFITVDLRE